MSYIHIREKIAYYGLKPLREVISYWAVQRFKTLCQEGSNDEDSFWEVMCELDNPKMSRDFYHLVHKRKIPMQDAWDHVIADGKTNEKSSVLKLGACGTRTFTRSVLRDIRVNRDIVLRSVPPWAQSWFRDHGIAHKTSNPTTVMRGMLDALGSDREVDKGLAEGLRVRFARMVQMVLMEIADPFTERDDRTEDLDTIVRARLYGDRDLIDTWIVMQVDARNENRVVRERPMCSLEYVDVTYNGGKTMREGKRVRKRRSPTRIFTNRKKAEKYATYLRLRVKTDVVVNNEKCFEVTKGDTTYLVSFRGRSKGVWGDARRGERKVMKGEWDELHEDILAITHDVTGVKQAVPAIRRRVNIDQDDIDDNADALDDLLGVPFILDEYRSANRKDVRSFRTHCNEAMWQAPLVFIDFDSNMGGTDTHSEFWNQNIIGVYVEGGIGYGVEHQFMTYEDAFSVSSSTGGEGHIRRRHLQNQRDLLRWYGFVLQNGEKEAWAEYAMHLTARKD